MKTCLVCGNPHDGTLGSGKFCSKSCIGKFASLSRTRETLDKINTANTGKHHSNESKEKIRNSLKNTISNFSDEKKEEVRKNHSLTHAPHKSYVKWSESSCKAQSLRRSEFINSGKAHCDYYSVWNGKKFIKVQGTWEKRIAEALTRFKINWERIIIPYAKTHHYTPDFYLYEHNMYLEIKGWMSPSNIIKYKKVVNETGIMLKLIDSIQLIKLFEEGKITIFDLQNFEEQYGT